MGKSMENEMDNRSSSGVYRVVAQNPAWPLKMGSWQGLVRDGARDDFGD